MHCPQCGHQQASSDTRFCSRCGLTLGPVIDLLAGGSDHVLQEKRELRGVALMIATFIMLFNFLFVFGVVTLPHLENSIFFWIWSNFLAGALVIGGLGLVNLIKSGFFKRLKEREARLGLMKAQSSHQLPAQQTEKLSLASGDPAYLGAVGSVTEVTTRELDLARKSDQR